MSHRIVRSLRLMFVLVLLVGLCAVGAPAIAHQHDFSRTTTDWPTSTPEEHGMDSAKLAGLWNMLTTTDTASEFGIPPAEGMSTLIHSALVIRHGNIVLDASAYPFTNGQPHEMFSVTKSFLSTLVGIAIDKGFIESTDQSIWDFFPKEDAANMEEQKASITLHHLLTHTSGLNIGLPTLTGAWLTDGKTYTQYILDSAIETAPGEAYRYQDGNADLVSALLQKATGKTAAEFAAEYLFGPLGITDADWGADPQGVSLGGWSLAVSAYDLAKLGYLFLNNGVWNDQQIVSSEWVEASINDGLEPLQPHFWEGYSNFWYDGPIGYWFNEPEGQGKEPRGFAAFGWGMQILVVVPDLDLILVTTGDLETMGVFSGLSDFILPAIQSDSALPANPAAYAELQAAVLGTAQPVATDVPPMPAMAETVAGKTYTLAENMLGWKAFSMTFGGDAATLTVEVGDSQLVLPIGLDGVYRLSTAGMPIDAAFFWHADAPLASKGGWVDDQTFRMEMWDVMGNEGFMITIPFDTLTITAVPVLYQEMAMAIQGTLRE